MNYDLPEIRSATYAKKSGDERRCKTCVLSVQELRITWAMDYESKYRCIVAGGRTNATGMCALHTSKERVKEERDKCKAGGSEK